MNAPGTIAVRDGSPPTDARLADDLRPDGTFDGDVRTVLVTGATGFLGRHVVRALLEDTSLYVVCLVRGTDDEAARHRLLAALADIGLDSPSLLARLETVAGSVTAPRLGLSGQRYAELARRVDAIRHVAAEVDWVKSYRRLRRTNVLGTLEVARFACTARPKHLLFVSSIATCYATDLGVPVDEDSDPLAHVDAMPLAYARTKCVAEHLLRTVAARGLAVTIVRPALICGHTVTGESSLDDLTAALIQSAVRSNVAADTDWLLDQVPVDHVARVVAVLPPASGLEVLHLVNERPRQWRELVLWLDLHGYPIRFEPIERWIERTFARRGLAPGDPASAKADLLGVYRRLFPPREAGSRRRRPFEVYGEAGQRNVCSERSHHRLRRLGLRTPVLDAALLSRYVAWFAGAGLIPSNDRAAATPVPPRFPSPADIEATARTDCRLADDEPLTVSVSPLSGHEGLLNELTGDGREGETGLLDWSIRSSDGATVHRYVSKTTGADAALTDACRRAAAHCAPELGERCGTFAAELGLSGAHEREIALQSLGAPSLVRHAPRTVGVRRDAASGRFATIMERLDEGELFTGEAITRPWSRDELDGAIRALARLHATPPPAIDALRRRGVLHGPPDTARMRRAAPLWRDLAAFADRRAAPPTGSLSARRRRWIDELELWWPALLRQPDGLVHNDFNPRNLTLRHGSGTASGGGVLVRAFDWELAAIGAPQLDLAELACFVFDPARNDAAAALEALLEHHRLRHAIETGVAQERERWSEGFALALRRFAITRLPTYEIIDRFRPLPWLPTVRARTEALAELTEPRVRSSPSARAA